MGADDLANVKRRLGDCNAKTKVRIDDTQQNVEERARPQINQVCLFQMLL